MLTSWGVDMSLEFAAGAAVYVELVELRTETSVLGELDLFCFGELGSLDFLCGIVDLYAWEKELGDNIHNAYCIWTKAG